MCLQAAGLCVYLSECVGVCVCVCVCGDGESIFVYRCSSDGVKMMKMMMTQRTFSDDTNSTKMHLFT